MILKKNAVSVCKIGSLVFFCFIFQLMPGCDHAGLYAQKARVARKYYISTSGNDLFTGSKQQPWQSIHRLNQLELQAGDSVFFAAGEKFAGMVLLDSADHGSRKKNIFIGSYGRGRAILLGGDSTAFRISGSHFLTISGLILRGNGRKQGNTGRGLFLEAGADIRISHLDISGFQKSGLEITDASDIWINRIDAHDNGYAGIAVTGNAFPRLSNHRIYIGHCKAHDNPGDPTALNNHSGNGIVVGLADHVLIEYCVATNNGWDMPRKGNGPVGIWAWEADSVIIQYCIAYRNRTAPGAADGGGFDLDGGVTNSIVQYNLAYENEGYGFGIFQFSGATPWHHNSFRYNLSFNDGNTTINGASVLWWNGSRDSSQFHDCYFYQNLLYNDQGYVLGVVPDEYDNSRFLFINNIFIGKDELMRGGKIRQELFYGNDWWSQASGFKLNGYTDFADWVTKTGREILDQQRVGMNLDPQLENPSAPSLTDPGKLKTLSGFRIRKESPIYNRGLDILHLFNIRPGGRDFYGNPAPAGRHAEPGIFEAD